MKELSSSAYLTLVEEIRTCTICPLSDRRTNAVPGEGNLLADIMFVGEAPGFNEDRQGKPFVGAAGRVLDEMLAGIGMVRNDVYIGNMIKCRPPDNRDPKTSEMEACRPYLDRQIELIDPKVIVTLGRHSFGKFFPGEVISKSRGRPRPWGSRIVFPVYHPAAVLHNPRLKPALEEDFRKLFNVVNSQGLTEPADAESSVDVQLGMSFGDSGHEDDNPLLEEPENLNSSTRAQTSQGQLF